MNTPSNPPAQAALKHWQTESNFYKDAVVLAIDIGMKGIGVVVRKGCELLLRQTFEFDLPEKSSVLKDRRQKRAQRRARVSRRRRDRMFKDWCVKHGLLTPEQASIFWRNDQPDEDWENENSRHAQRVFEHRWRAINQGVASPMALAVCLRHLVQRRGFDYHLTEESSFPWGDSLKFFEIAGWLRTTAISEEYGRTLKVRLFEENAEVFNKQEVNDKLATIIDEAVERHSENPIREMLKVHVSEKNHLNLRKAARGSKYNFPRELVKAHAWEMLDKHRRFFPEDRFDEAVKALLGDSEVSGAEQRWLHTESCILDYHRKTREEMEIHWQKKTGPCPYAKPLHAEGLVSSPVARRAKKKELIVRKFMLVQFLAERKFEDRFRWPHYTSVETVRWLLEQVEADAKAVEEATQRPKFGIKFLRAEFESRHEVKLATGKRSRNADFFDQLNDLLSQQRGKLEQRASMSKESAEALFKLATDNGRVFGAEPVRERLKDYYQWRRNNDSAWALYPQVEFLMGARQQYDEAGKSKDVRNSAPCAKNEGKGKRGAQREDKLPQEHGIIRRLFTGQLKDAHGKREDFREELNRADLRPEYVVIEVAGDIPRSEEERTKYKEKQKAGRESKTDIITAFGLSEASPTGLKKKALLLDQQRDKDGNICCPYTGEILFKKGKERVSLSDGLQTEHIFPDDLGGLTVQDNLCVTRTSINAAKGRHTPFQIQGTTSPDGIKFLAWKKMKEQAGTFRWGPKKMEIFEWDREGEIPDFENTTRLAQLARQLRSEIIRWLGIRNKFNDIADSDEQSNQIANEIARRVGTPTGSHTHACAEVWLSPTEFPDYWRPVKRGNAAEDWEKERCCQLHHLWDAILLSYIPPGQGLNNTMSRGIFEVDKTSPTGAPRLRPLRDLGPPTTQFPRADAQNASPDAETLVFRKRREKTKGKRTLENPASLRDGEGRSWAREPLAGIARRIAKNKSKRLNTDVKKLAEITRLLRTGQREGAEPHEKGGAYVSESVLPDKKLAEWWENRAPTSMTKDELLDFLQHNGVEAGRVPSKTLDEWWKYQGKMPERKEIKPGGLLVLFKKCGFPKDQISEARVTEWIEEESKLGILFLKPMKVDGDPQSVTSIRVEQDHKPATSYIAHTSRADGKGKIIGIKAVNEAYYCHKFFKYSESRSEGEKEVKFCRLMLPHPRNQRNFEKLHKLPVRSWRPGPECWLPAAISTVPTGAEEAGFLRKGQLLRVPINKKYSIAKRGESATHGWWWCRVASLESSGAVELRLAEFTKQTKPKKESDMRKLPPLPKKLIQLGGLKVQKDADIVYLLELNKPERVKTDGWRVPPAQVGRKAKRKPATKKNPKRKPNVKAESAQQMEMKLSDQ